MKHLTAVIAVLLLLAACGDVDDGSETELTTPTQTDLTEAADSETPAGTTADTNADTQAEDIPTEDTAAFESEPGDAAPREGPDEETPLPERVSPTTGAPVTGEGPSDLVASIKVDLVARTGAAEADLVVIRSEEVIWNDGSLGCPVPGDFYTQAQVSGYWIVLEHNGVAYDYRASDSGFFRLCEGGSAPPTNPTG